MTYTIFTAYGRTYRLNAVTGATHVLITGRWVDVEEVATIAPTPITPAPRPEARNAPPLQRHSLQTSGWKL